MSAEGPARTIAVRHLAEDIALAHAEGDGTTATTLAKALSTLVAEIDGERGQVIDIERVRKPRF